MGMLIQSSNRSGKYVEVGKGSLHIRFPYKEEMYSDTEKKYWYFNGFIREEDGKVVLIGSGDVSKDFVALKSKRKERTAEIIKVVYHYQYYYKDRLLGLLPIAVF